LHSSGYTPDSIDFDIPSAYQTRADLYNVGGIPHTEWNGVHAQVGGYGGGNWEAIYPTFLNLIETYIIEETPWSIGISGTYELGQEVTYDIELLIDDIDSTLDVTDLYLEMFLVEDSIYSYWGSVNEWHNARYVLRKYITKSQNLKHPISITNANETEHFTGTVDIDGDAWVDDNLSIIAFVQKLDGCCTEQVYQVHRWKINDLDPDPDGDGLTYLYDNCHYDYNPGQEDADEDGLGNACDGCNGLVNILGNINLDAEGDDFTPIIDVADVLAFADLLENNDLINDCHILDMLEDGEINQWDLIVLVDLVMAGS